jgi:hypothetical protein
MGMDNIFGMGPHITNQEFGSLENSFGIRTQRLLAVTCLRPYLKGWKLQKD